MFTRSVAACLSFFAVAAAAQAGPPLRAEINLYPHNPGPYPEGGEVFMVDISVRQVAGASKDRLLRYAQFDFSDTHPDLLAGLSLPVTHDRILAVDDIHFWQFGSQAETVCPDGDPADPGCGEGHFIEDEYAGQRPGLVAIAFLGYLDEPLFENPDLGEDADWQLPLPTDPSWLKIGTVEVTLPMADGDYLLDVMNADDVDPDMGAQLRWGFGPEGNPNDPVTAWRASAGEIEGGTLNFRVGVGKEPPVVDSWESVADHGGSGEIGLVIPADESYVESRWISKIVVNFSGDLSAAVGEGNVTRRGCYADGSFVDLSLTTVTVALAAGDATKLEISFDPKLPGSNLLDPNDRPARYEIGFTGLTNPTGVPVADDQRVFTALLGDVGGAPTGGDLLVSNIDVGGVRGFRDMPFDPNNAFSVRSDVNADGVVSNIDVGGVRGLRDDPMRNHGPASCAWPP